MHCVHYVIKRVFLSSYIFYFRQNGHKVNNKCGTSCGQCGLRGQKRVVVCDHSLLTIYSHLLSPLTPTELNFLNYIYFYKHIIFCCQLFQFLFSIFGYGEEMNNWHFSVIFLFIYFSKLLVTF